MAQRRSTLDLLRLAAATSVMLFHFVFRMEAVHLAPGMEFPGPAAAIARHLVVGLQVFFVISGYVISMSAEGRSALGFAVSRVARLWPSFVVATTISAVLLAAFGLPQFQPSLAQWLANLAMVAPLFGERFMDGVYWSIVYELIFYGFVAMLVATGHVREALGPVAFVWLGVSMANELVLENPLLQLVLLTDFSPFFAVGIALRLVETTPGPAARWLLAAALLCVGPSAWLENARNVIRYRVEPDTLTMLVVTYLGIAAVAVAVRLPVERLGIRPRTALVLGGLTYPVYLLHQHVGYSIFARLSGELGPWTVLALVAAGSYAIAWAIFRYVEPAGRRLVEATAARLLGTRRRRAAVTSAAE